VPALAVQYRENVEILRDAVGGSAGVARQLETLVDPIATPELTLETARDQVARIMGVTSVESTLEELDTVATAAVVIHTAHEAVLTGMMRPASDAEEAPETPNTPPAAPKDEEPEAELEQAGAAEEADD